MLSSVEKMYEVWLEIIVIHGFYTVT